MSLTDTRDVKGTYAHALQHALSPLACSRRTHASKLAKRRLFYHLFLAHALASTTKRDPNF
jgi:adenylylsulfate kinase-like enzyme